MSLLEVEAINSFYGDSHILFDVSLRVEQNEVVALLGRNGAGKTTTLRTIMGVLTPGSGSIRLDGKPIHGRPPYEIARLGMQLVPEERAIFGALHQKFPRSKNKSKWRSSLDVLRARRRSMIFVRSRVCFSRARAGTNESK